MALVTRFDTPASLTDTSVAAFYTEWHNFIASNLSTIAGSGTAVGEFYDASEVDVTIAAEHSLVWMAFPRQVLVNNRDDRRAAFIFADSDPVVRNPQNEYCEWHVTRNAAGKITKVVFVTETPEYWTRLWNFDRPAVVNLYRTLLNNPAITEPDLEQPGPGHVYKPNNTFNTTGGIVHLIQSINNLTAAMSLAEGSVATGAARDGYETPPPSPPGTSVDPRVKFDIGALARKPLSITLREPIGLYIAGFDDTGWTKPDGSPVGNYWTIVRGVPGMALRVEYQVPPSEGFVVGDIRIGGRSIEWGGQIAEHVTVTIAGVAGTRGRA
jgi:hypothetical protein